MPFFPKPATRRTKATGTITPAQASNLIMEYRNQNMRLKRQLHAKFDAAQTFSGNENHWANADNFDPHSVASLPVRRLLRSRSRYECIENNPFLKGTLITICNDFIGGGPKLQITDRKISEERAALIQERWVEWCHMIKLRTKLWRMRMAKIVDGESFAIPYVNKSRFFQYPMLLDFHILETDRISSQTTIPTSDRNVGEIDGVRFDQYENPLQYFILNSHPGGGTFAQVIFPSSGEGKWVDARFVLHWFRQDRGWLRGIPETTTSLPLCSVLRRYTLAMVRNAEVVTDMTVLLESQNPILPGIGQGGEQDIPYDLIPLEVGMIMNLPFGYKASQLKSVPLGAQYDEFVGSVLREITRPLLVTYNMASGSSKDSNMASGVLDSTIYKTGQESERLHCNEFVLDRILYYWWQEAMRIPGYLGTESFTADGKLFDLPPSHRWRWDRIGIDHTDPSKVAASIETLHTKRFITDSDVQEWYFNRDLGTWQREILSDDKFRGKLKPTEPQPEAPPGGPPSKNGKPPAKKKPAKAQKHRRRPLAKVR